jgi:hypothetical protein
MSVDALVECGDLPSLNLESFDLPIWYWNVTIAGLEKDILSSLFIWKLPVLVKLQEGSVVKHPHSSVVVSHS